MKQKNNKLLELYKAMYTNEAVATHFEEAIIEQGLTQEVLSLLIHYYKDEV